MITYKDGNFIERYLKYDYKSGESQNKAVKL
jgi:hypothetical protein